MQLHTILKFGSFVVLLDPLKIFQNLFVQMFDIIFTANIVHYSNCVKCSNIYLLIIIPIALAGILLVMMFFLLNLTVVDGLINSFMLYVNVISTNGDVLFPSGVSAAAYAFISMVNLDLGIETCFYNGMDDYAKI